MHKSPELIELCAHDEDYRKGQDRKAVREYGPSNLRKFRNVSLALAKQMLAGNPTCDQATIDARADACNQCDAFIGGICSEDACGCPMDDRRWLSKLAFATSVCPRGEW